MSIESPTDLATLVKGDEVHQSVYTAPGIFTHEIERLFGRTWIFVAHDSEIPRPGDFKTDQLSRWRLLLVRRQDGGIGLFHNVCRHRGALLCHEAYGNTQAFKCMYHGWTFANDGALQGVPMREHMRGLDLPAHGLVPIPRVKSYQGFIFASLAPEGESLEEYLGGAKRYLDLMVARAPEQAIAAIKPVQYHYRGNWKLQVENYFDNYHPAVLHHSALSIGVQMLKEKFGDQPLNARSGGRYVERVLGHGHSMADYQGGRGALWMNAYDDEYLRTLAKRVGTGRAQELRDADIHLIIYPNLLIHVRMNHYRVIKPVSVDHTIVNTYPCKLVGSSKRVNDALIYNTSHHVSAAGEVQVDDLQAFNWVQEGLGSGAIEWIPFKLYGEEEHLDAQGENVSYGTSEAAIRGQYREWARWMTAPATDAAHASDQGASYR
jgi:benzoate/toluate 1,2-dioxygenase alpha subunit